MVERLEVDETLLSEIPNIPTLRLLFLGYGWRTFRGSRVIPRVSGGRVDGVYRMELGPKWDRSSGALAISGADRRRDLPIFDKRGLLPIRGQDER